MPANTDFELILASSSPYRQRQLTQLGLSFSCFSPNIDENPLAGESPADLASRLAKTKADSYQANNMQFVIGSDQVADLNGLALGKPGNKEKATAQLKACSGRQVVFHTALCVRHNQSYAESSSKTLVNFRQLSDIEIANYIEREPALDCAGSFKCEGLGITLFESIQSDDPSALIGLPLIQLNKSLIQLGFNCLD